MISTYTITGMTCGNCVSHVNEEVSAIAGVDQVDVTLAGGSMAIMSVEPIDFELVRAAVAEAGAYKVSAN